MKYMIMECHPGYAVVLDEKGEFRKVANMHYEVGQTVTDVIPLQVPTQAELPVRRRNTRWLYTLAAAAACLLLILLPGLFPPQAAFASVYLTINPEVRIDVDRNDRVLGLEGVNPDGISLIEGYDFMNKELDLVVDELVDRAIEKGFLFEGGKVTLTLDGEDNDWIVSHTDSLTQHLNEHLENKMTVTIEVCDRHSHGATVPIGDTVDDHDDDPGDDHDDEHDDDRDDEHDDDPDDDHDDVHDDDPGDDHDDVHDDDPGDDHDDEHDDDSGDEHDDVHDDDPDDDHDDDSEDVADIDDDDDDEDEK